MKKQALIGLLTLVIIVSVIITGCTKEVTSTATTTKTTTSVTTTTEQFFVWKGAVTTPAVAPPGQVFTELAKKIEEATNGRVKIEICYSSSLLTASEQLKGTAAGVADISDYWGVDTSIATYYSLLTLPGIAWPDATKSTEILWNLYNKYPEMVEEFSGQGVHLLYDSCWGVEGGIATTKKQIKTLEDLAGLKMGTSGATALWYQAMGASPIFVAYEDSYMSMSSGLVDAYGANFAWMKGGGVQDLVKYVTMFGATVQQSHNAIMVCQKSWDALPADLQQKITDLLDWYAARRFEAENATNQTVREQVAARGVPFYTLPEEELARWAALSGQIHADHIAQMTATTGKTRLQEVYEDLLSQCAAAFQ